MTLETRQEEEMLEKVRAIDAAAIGKIHEILTTVRRIEAALKELTAKKGALAAVAEPAKDNFSEANKPVP